MLFISAKIRLVLSILNFTVKWDRYNKNLKCTCENVKYFVIRTAWLLIIKIVCKQYSLGIFRFN